MQMMFSFWFRSTGSYEPDHGSRSLLSRWAVFRSTGSYEPDPVWHISSFAGRWFRSTGSYEPDPVFRLILVFFPGFDPQALTSLTFGSSWNVFTDKGFDPQALTSLTVPPTMTHQEKQVSFDPQALTSLTLITACLAG